MIVANGSKKIYTKARFTTPTIIQPTLASWRVPRKCAKVESNWRYAASNFLVQKVNIDTIGSPK
jgi:hypothetical protein